MRKQALIMLILDQHVQHQQMGAYVITARNDEPLLFMKEMIEPMQKPNPENLSLRTQRGTRNRVSNKMDGYYYRFRK